jgi:hypothetical protein
VALVATNLPRQGSTTTMRKGAWKALFCRSMFFLEFYHSILIDNCCRYSSEDRAVFHRDHENDDCCCVWRGQRQVASSATRKIDGFPYLLNKDN